MNLPVVFDQEARQRYARSFSGFASHMQRHHKWTDIERAQAYKKFLTYERENQDFTTLQNLFVAFNCTENHIQEYLEKFNPNDCVSNPLAAFFETCRIERFLSYPQVATLSNCDESVVRKICKNRKRFSAKQEYIDKLLRAFYKTEQDLENFDIERDAIIIDRDVISEFVLKYIENFTPKLTQEKFAKLCGVNKATISLIVNKVRDIKPETLQKICEVTKLSPRDISDFGKGSVSIQDLICRVDPESLGMYTQKYIKRFDIDVTGFGNFLKVIRDEKNWSEDDLAKHFNEHALIVKSHENGRVKQPYAPFLKSVINTLQIDPRDLERYCKTQSISPRLSQAIKSLPN